MEHELKIDPSFYEAVISDAKNFEIRFNDRGFQKGDILSLREYKYESFLSEARCYTGRSCRRIITYVLNGYGLQDGYVVLGLKPE